MRDRALFGTRLTRCVAPQGGPLKAPVAGFTGVTAPIFVHLSHVSWPRRELRAHMRGRARSEMAHPSRFVAPLGAPPSSTEGPSGRVRMRDRAQIGTRLTRFVVPWGAPPKAPMAGFAPLAAPQGRADRRADQP